MKNTQNVKIHHSLPFGLKRSASGFLYTVKYKFSLGTDPAENKSQ